MLFWYLAIYIGVSSLLILNAKRALKFANSVKQSKAKPSVSIIFPIKGKTEHTEKCVRSWVTQTYSGTIQFIFSFQDKNDPAIELIQELSKDLNAVICINERLEEYSGKCSNLHYGYLSAKNEIIVFSDFDMEVSKSTLTKIIHQLENDRTLVSCLPVHIQAASAPAKIYSYIWNSVLACLWAPSMIDEKSVGVAGGVLAFNRNLLDAVGGVKNFSNYLAEDLIFGDLVKKAGGNLVLGPAVQSPVAKQSFRQLIQNMKRAHLIAIHYSSVSFILSFIGILIGYLYTVLPIVSLLRQDYFYLKMWSLFLIVRFFYLASLNYFLQSRLVLDFSFFVGDPLNLMTYFICFFDKSVWWGEELHHVGPKAKILK